MIVPRKKPSLVLGQTPVPTFKERIQDIARNPIKMSLVLILVGFMGLFHSLFSYYTIFSFGLVVFSFGFLLKTVIKQIHEKGLITYLPLKLQNFLLNRSVFDVLCDLWFIPKIGLYLKAFFGPFYYESTPEKALNSFEVIGLTRAVTVKGFINLFPGLKKIILPPNFNSILSSENNNNKGNHNKIEKDGFESGSSETNTSSCSLVSEEEKNEHEEKKENESEISPKKEINNNFNSNFNNFGLKNSHFVNIQSTVVFQSQAFKGENFPLIIKDEKRERFNEESNKNTKKNKRSPHLFVSPQNYFYEDNVEDIMMEKTKKQGKNNKKQYFLPKSCHNIENEDIIPKTIVLKSNKKQEKQALESIKRASLVLDDDVLVSNAWDNRKKFELKQLEEQKKIDAGHVEETQQMKGVFNIVNLLNEIKKNGILSKINNRLIMKLLTVSSIGMFLQLKYNKKARDWIVNSVMYMGFSAVLVLFGSSFAILIVKSLNEKTKKK